MPHLQSEAGFLWLLPWDPIYTPFTREEMLDLVPADGRGTNSPTRISAAANWVHPEDPLNRVRHYNFWDVLQESLNRRLLVSKDQRTVDDKLVPEFVDFISRSFDYISENSVLSNTFGVPLTSAARIHRVLLGIKADVIVSNIPYMPRRWILLHGGQETVTLLLQEALDLILRVEIFLHRCHPEIDGLGSERTDARQLY